MASPPSICFVQGGFDCVLVEGKEGKASSTLAAHDSRLRCMGKGFNVAARQGAEVELRSCELLEGHGGLHAEGCKTLVKVFAGGISRNPKCVGEASNLHVSLQH
jgi:hypothetical protein